MRRGNLFYLSILGVLLILIVSPVIFCNNNDPIVAADELYSKRSNPINVQQAIDILQKFTVEKSNNSEALWRLARCYWFIGDAAAAKKDKLEFFTKGKEYADQAVQANPNSIEGHHWLAALLGSTGETRGILQSLKMVDPMKKELDICIQLDNNYADAHFILAQLYWKAPGPPLSIGNKKTAQEEAKLATSLNPNIIEYWLHLGLIAKDNKDYATAREAFKKALSLPDDPEEPKKSQSDKTTAVAELKKIETKK